MKLRIPIIACVLLMAGALCGCLEVREEYTIRNDGTGTAKIRIVISKPGEFKERSGELSVLLPLNRSAAETFFPKGGVRLANFSKEESENKITIALDYEFQHITDINDGVMHVASYTKDAEGNYDFKMTGQFLKNVEKALPEYKEMMGELAGRFANYNYTIKVNFPKTILNVRAGYQSGNSLVWKKSIGAILQAKSPRYEIAGKIRGAPRTSGTAFKVIYTVMIVLMVVSGFSARLLGATLNFFLLLFAAIIALNFFEPISSLTREYINFAPEYHNALVFIVLFAGLVLFGQELVIGRGREWLEVHRLVDIAGSVVFGFLAGLIMAGVIAVFYFLLPWQEDGIRGRLDPANPPTLLKIYRAIANKAPGPNEFDPVGEWPVSLKNHR